MVTKGKFKLLNRIAKAIKFLVFGYVAIVNSSAIVIFQIQTNVALLKPKMENFVLALLRIGWADQDIGVVNAYREFLINLITAQGYYTKPVMKVIQKFQYEVPEMIRD